jgi:MFS family permease
MILMPLVDSRAMFFAFFLVMGFVSGGATFIPYSKVIAVRFARRRGLAFGLGAAGVGLGGMFLPHFTVYAIDSYGWRGGFVALGVLVAGLSFSCLWFGLRGSTALARRRDEGQVLAHSPWRSRSLRRIGIAGALISISVSGIMVHAVAIITDRGFTPNGAATLMSVVAVASIIGRIGGGYLMDQLFAPLVAACLFLLAALGVVLIILGGMSGTLYIGMICIGLVVGAETDVMTYLVSRYCLPEEFGQVFGAMYLIFMVAGAAAVSLLGLGYDLVKSYSACLTVAAILAALAAYVVSRLGPYDTGMTEPR